MTTNPVDWPIVEEILNRALDLPPAERAAYVDRVCGSDERLRREVESLLAFDAPDDSFLESPALSSLADLPEASADPLAGRRIGPYQLLREIGRGGMGAVFLAMRDDGHYQKQVAIKVIKRGLDTDFILRRFLSERQILASLDHPNIARLLDGGATQEGLPYLVMEYVEGRPITAYCEAERLPIAERLRLFREACAAVHYAHQHLVIHRDLKPSNILVTADGKPKLLDFGIAKMLDPDVDVYAMEVTATALRMMTPNYASPEQVRGLPVTTASDVYSLGVLLYELLTGHRPYRLKGHSAEEIMRAVLEDEPVKPSTVIRRTETAEEAASSTGGAPETLSPTRADEIARLKRSLSGDLDNILLMALRKEPQRRYASVEQFSEDLRRHLEGLPVIAHKDTFTYRSAKFIKRNKVAVLAALLIVIAVTSGAVTTLRQRARAERRFNEVRKLAHSVIFDYHDAIANLQGSTPVRERLVKDALEYLDSLAQESSNDSALQNELAEAYLKIGDVQGNSYYSNLGDTDGALASYRKAVQICEHLLSAAPNDAEVRQRLARSYEDIGDVVWDLNDLPGALENYQRALTLAETSAAQLKTTKAKLYLAQVHTSIADLCYHPGYNDLGDLDGAMQHLRQGLQIRESLAAGDPENSQILLYLKVSYSRLANIQREIGERASALAYARKEQQICEKFAAEHPENAFYRREVALSYLKLANLLMDGGNADEALQDARQSQEIRESLAQSDPSNQRWQHDLLVGYFTLSELRLRLGRIDEAFEYVHREVELGERLYVANLGKSELGGTLTEAHLLAGNLLRKKGEPTAALVHYSRALAISQAQSPNPTSAIDRGNLAQIFLGRGAAMADLGNLTEGLDEVLKGVAIYEDLVKAPPFSIPQQIILAHAHSQLAETYAALAAKATIVRPRLEQLQQARAAYQRSLDRWLELKGRNALTPPDLNEPERVAGLLARCDAALTRSL